MGKDDRAQGAGIVPASDGTRPGAVAVPAADTGGLDAIDYLARHSRSFRFATRFMAGPEARRIAEIYAFCRYTDDLVDRADGATPAELAARLDRWEALAGTAYRGQATGSPLLDGPIAGMGRDGIPFAYARELIEGMRMDLYPRRYADMAELETYTYRVAGTVGQWLAEREGVKDPWALERAADLGHAMQITNILRDVGEDLARGRLYLPLDMLARHGLSPSDLEAMAAGNGEPSAAYRDLVEEMMECAEARYQSAFRAIPCLPPSFQRPVLIAALVYRGIHGAIRRNGYDNFRKRARTGAWDKARISIKTQWMLASLRELFPARRRPERGAHASMGAAAKAGALAVRLAGPFAGACPPSGACA